MLKNNLNFIGGFLTSLFGSELFQTALLAFVGAICSFITSYILKWIKEEFDRLDYVLFVKDESYEKLKKRNSECCRNCSNPPK